MRKIQTRFTVDQDLFDWLKNQAAKQRVSMSSIIREWIMRDQRETAEADARQATAQAAKGVRK